MKVILIRHGETYANELYHTENRMLIGALENEWTQLNEAGKKQALEAKEIMDNIHVDEIYSSDLNRAIETAQIIFGNQDIQVTPLLRERSLGWEEGLNTIQRFLDEDVWKYHMNPEIDTIEECLNKKTTDGESYQMVIDRCIQFLNQFDYKEDKTIVIVGHFHLIRCMHYLLLNKEIDKDLFTMMIDNASPMIYEYINHKFIKI